MNELKSFVWAFRGRCSKCGGKWVYRNPADRTCKKCNRHEQFFCLAWDHKTGEWEEMVPSPFNATNPYLGG